MAYTPEVRTEAFELYLLGNSPAAIAKELRRRHPGADTPSAGTLERWAYVPDASGKTWSERRYDAERAAQEAVTTDFVAAKQKHLAGLLKLQGRLEARALDAAASAEQGNMSQEIYAYVNVTKATAKMLDVDLAEQARVKDAVDCLMEAIRRVVPKFDAAYGVKVRAEFERLVAAKAPNP